MRTALVFLWMALMSHTLAAQEEGIFPFVEQAPVPLNLKDITQRIPYPAEAYQAGIEGWVQVMVKVDETGKYLEHMIARSPHSLLSHAVAPYMSCMEFNPAYTDQKPVTAWVAIPFRFTIHMGGTSYLGSTGFICPPDSQPSFKPIARTP